MAKTPSAQAKQIEQEVTSVLRKFDLTTAERSERDSLIDLMQALANGRIYANAYELSETREEQEKNAKLCKQWLGKARTRILKASESNIFGPVDVASLSAQIDQLRGDLK